MRKTADRKGTGITAEAGFFSDGETAAAFYGRTSATVAALTFLSFSQRLLTRLPLPGSASVPFYPADYFRGDNERRRFNSLVITNSSLAFSIPGWSPTFAELLILDSLTAGPFFDLRYNGDDFAYTIGSEVSASLSFIGLKPFTLHFDAGWTTLDNGPVLSFYIKS